MATKVGSMKAKSKSESSQNRPKRPAKYRSMTLRRQEAKCDVTINVSTCDEEELQNSIFDDSRSSSANLNSSFMDKCKFLTRLFMTPPSSKSASPSMTSSSSVNDPTRVLSRKRSFVLYVTSFTFGARWQIFNNSFFFVGMIQLLLSAWLKFLNQCLHN